MSLVTNNPIPSQAGHGGQFLQTNGSFLSWSNIASSSYVGTGVNSIQATTGQALYLNGGFNTQSGAQIMLDAYIPGALAAGIVLAPAGGGQVAINTDLVVFGYSYFGTSNNKITPDGKIQTYGPISLYNDNQSVYFQSEDLANAGALAADADGIIVPLASDRRLKENITSYTGGLDTINKLQPVRFNFTSGCGMNIQGTKLHFIAQDVLPILPEAVGQTKLKIGNHCNIYTFDDGAVVAALVGAVKELTERIKVLESDINK